MARRNCPVVPEAQAELDKFKQEVSRELGVEINYTSHSKTCGHVPAHRCGDVGGSMVKKMIEAYEQKLIK